MAVSMTGHARGHEWLLNHDWLSINQGNIHLVIIGNDQNKKT